jgi:hypothetical protein
MAASGGTALLAVWVPAVAAAHVLAACFLIQTLLLASPAAKRALSKWLRPEQHRRLLPRAVVVGANDLGGCGPAATASRSSSSDAHEGPPASKQRPPGGSDALMLVVAEARGCSDASSSSSDDDSTRNDGNPAGEESVTAVAPADPAGCVLLRWQGLGLNIRAAAGPKWVLRDASGEASGGEMQVRTRGC